MNNTKPTKIKYIKTFSKGQMTIPKSFREQLGLKNEFWLKLNLVGPKIIIEPIKENKVNPNYAGDLLSIKGDWFDYADYKKMRSQTNKRAIAYGY